MHLHIADSVYILQMSRHIIIDHRRIHNGFLYTHSKKRVRIASESLRIKEVSPASHSLSENKSQYTGIRHRKEIQLLFLTKNDTGRNCSKNPSVNRKSPLPDIWNLHKMLRIIVPFKDDIVNSCPDYAKDDNEERKVLDVVRLVTAPHILFTCNKHP